MDPAPARVEDWVEVTGWAPVRVGDRGGVMDPALVKVEVKAGVKAGAVVKAEVKAGVKAGAEVMDLAAVAPRAEGDPHDHRHCQRQGRHRQDHGGG